MEAMHKGIQLSFYTHTRARHDGKLVYEWLLEHARKHDKVWFCTGHDIAEHWRREHPPGGA